MNPDVRRPAGLAMPEIVECVPNFSEGRRKEVVDAIAQAIASVHGVRVLDEPGSKARLRVAATPSDRGGVHRRSAARPHRLEREPPDHGCRCREAHREGDPGERWRTAGGPGKGIRPRGSRARSGLHEHGGLSQDVTCPSIRSDPCAGGERRRRNRGERDHRTRAAGRSRGGGDPILEARSVPSRASPGDTPVGMKDRTLEEFLAAVAAPTPTPGGGSVSALAGALSVALSRMVAGLARGKKGYEGAEAELAQLETRAKKTQARLEALIDEDAKAYDDVMTAMHLPKSTEKEKAARVEAMQRAYQRATEVPLETMERCIEALELAEAAVKKGSRSAVTGAAVAVLLAESAIRGASLNCSINLASIRDEAFRTQAETRVENLLKRADEIGHEAMAVVTSRL